MPSPRNFRGSRRALALVLSEGPKTASETGKALDKPTGSIFGVLKRMVSEGLVVADTGTPERGTRYSLSPSARNALQDMERETVATGAVTSGQQLLLVEPSAGMAAVQRVLAQDWITGLVAWAAEVCGGWLLAVDAESSYPLQRLMMALEEAGAASRSLPVNGVLSGDELRDRASWLLEDLEQSR